MRDPFFHSAGTDFVRIKFLINFADMSSRSNNQGRAYEYACIMALDARISGIRPCMLVRNTCLSAAEKAWNTLSPASRQTYTLSALAATDTLFSLEPRILETTGDQVELMIQPDSNGISGDVRDILIIRRAIGWETGLSLKHNSFAVKHSRLSQRIDFGAKWYGIPCSINYWKAVSPVFGYLSAEKKSRRKFHDLPDKDGDVYLPLLDAFINEIAYQSELHKEVPRRMVEYLLGKQDFYKIISMDSDRVTRIQSFNMHSSLNLPSSVTAPGISVPVTSLPTRIEYMGLCPGKNNTAEIRMDGGWQFSFRIHNASDMVEPSLKFDVQITGMPASVMTINCSW